MEEVHLTPSGVHLPNQGKDKEYVEKEDTPGVPIARTGESRKQPQVAKAVFPEHVNSTIDLGP